MNNTNILEYKRLTEGEGALKEEFLRRSKANKSGAVSLLNDRWTTFPTLYMLIPEIKSQGIENRLSERNSHALGLCGRASGEEDSFPHTEAAENSPEYKQSLIWIVNTGSGQDGLSEQYDEILDKAACILVISKKEKSVLPAVVDMIFKRGEEGRFNHDLIWALFKSSDRDAFKRAALYLRSGKTHHADLARELLCFIPLGSISASIGGRTDEYTRCVNWINTNSPYLIPTELSNQYSSQPKAYELDTEAKYLGIPSMQKQSAPSDVLQYLEKLRGLDDEQRELLAEASGLLRSRSRRAWLKWLESPADSQLVMARTMTEGMI